MLNIKVQVTNLNPQKVSNDDDIYHFHIFIGTFSDNKLTLKPKVNIL